MTADPAVSVVIPALNAATTLRAQLSALSLQSMSVPWEIVLVDNGSEDNTAAEACRSPRHDSCSLRIVHEPRRGLNIARNAGVRAAHAQLIAICDADDTVADEWLPAMLDALRDVDIAVGLLDVVSLNTAQVSALRGWSDLAEPIESIGTELRFLDQTLCGNVAFDKDVWTSVGGFDERLAWGGDDVDFGWHAQLAGYRVGSAPGAVIRYRARSDRRSLFRQYVRDGEGSAHLYAIHRDNGMPRRSCFATLRTTAWVCVRLPLLWRHDLQTQGHVLRAAGKQWGRVRGSIRHRVVYP